MTPSLHTFRLGSDGPLLLALHGGLGWDTASLRPWLDPLADRARLTFVDLLGCGASPDPGDWDAVTHASFADGVEDVRQWLGSESEQQESVVVFGHSYGALVALEYARRYPERVGGLVLCCPPSRPDHLGAGAERAQARVTDLPPTAATAMEGVFAGPPPDDATFTGLMTDVLPLYVADHRAHDLASYADGIRFRAAPARRSFYELFVEHDAREGLSDLDVPALVLSGRHDWVCPPDEGPAEIADALGANHHVFERSGHLPFLEEPEAFLSVVGGWLDPFHSP